MLRTAIIAAGILLHGCVSETPLFTQEDLLAVRKIADLAIADGWTAGQRGRETFITSPEATSREASFPYPEIKARLVITCDLLPESDIHFSQPPEAMMYDYASLVNFLLWDSYESLVAIELAPSGKKLLASSTYSPGERSFPLLMPLLEVELIHLVAEETQITVAPRGHGKLPIFTFPTYGATALYTTHCGDYELKDDE